MIFVQPLSLNSKRFFDLHDHLGFFKDLVGGPEYSCPSSHVIFVTVANTSSQFRFHKNIMITLRKLVNRRGSHARAIFVILDFFGDADLHSQPLNS